MEDKIANEIALHQASINELLEIKNNIETTSTNDVRFKIETKHWYGYSEPFLYKRKDKLKISIYTMKLILNEAIKNEKEKINLLIDRLVDNKIRTQNRRIQNGHYNKKQYKTITKSL